MERKRLILHIGLPKTASTAIQKFCHSRRNLLAKAGLYYPKTGLRYAGHHEFARAFASQASERRNLSWIRQRDSAELMQQLRDELKNQSAPSVLLSSEAFFQLASPTNVLDAFAKDFDVEVVGVVRRQDLWLESLYNQHAKMINRCFTPEQYLDSLLGENRFDYHALGLKWAGRAGPDSVRYIPFEPSSFVSSSVVATFLQGIGFDQWQEVGAGEKIQTNESLSRAAIAYLQRMPNDGRMRRTGATDEALRLALGRYSRERDDTPPQQRRFYSPQQRRDLLTRYESSNAAAALAFLRQGEGPLFSDADFPTDTESWEPFPGLSDEAFAEIADYVFRSLYREQAKLLKENSRLRQQLRQQQGVLGSA